MEYQFKRKEKVVRAENLKCGDLFRYDKQIFLKTEDLYRCIDIKTGKMGTIDKGLDVVLLQYKLIIME